MSNLKSLLGRQIVCADFGASGGLYAPFLNHKALAKYILIEPSGKQFQHLRVDESIDAICLNIAAGITTENKDLYDPELGGASLYKRNDSIVSKYVQESLFEGHESEETISVKSVAEIFSEACIYNLDAVKIDTQGSELDILKGLQDAMLLEHVLLAQVELPSIPSSYIGQPPLSACLKFLEEQGFVLLNLRANNAHHIVSSTLFAKHGKLGVSARAMDIDALFVRDPASVIERGKNVVAIYVVLLCSFKHFLEAQHVTEMASVLRMIDEGEKEVLLSHIRARYKTANTLFVRSINNTPLPIRVRAVLQSMLCPLLGSYEPRWFPHGG